jgi:hypothetical protein
LTPPLGPARRAAAGQRKPARELIANGIEAEFRAGFIGEMRSSSELGRRPEGRRLNDPAGLA